MTDYIIRKDRGDADDVEINSDDVVVTSQSAHTVDDLFKRSYGPTIYPADVVGKGPWVDVRSFGASGSAQQTTGSITAGEYDLVLTDAKDFADGMGVRVSGAGASGADLVAVVESGGGTTTLTLDTAASTTVSNATVAHDDQSSFDAAVNYAASNDVKVLFVPRAAFNYSSALTLTAGLSVVGYEEFSYTSTVLQQALQFTLPDNSAWSFWFRTVGKVSDASDVGCWIHSGIAWRYNAGSATLVNNDYHELLADYDAVNLQCYPSVSSNDLRLNVRGVLKSSVWHIQYMLEGI